VVAAAAPVFAETGRGGPGAGSVPGVLAAGAPGICPRNARRGGAAAGGHRLRLTTAVAERDSVLLGATARRGFSRFLIWLQMTTRPRISTRRRSDVTSLPGPASRAGCSRRPGVAAHREQLAPARAQCDGCRREVAHLARLGRSQNPVGKPRCPEGSRAGGWKRSARTRDHWGDGVEPGRWQRHRG